jgi:hypothetical protein
MIKRVPDPDDRRARLIGRLTDDLTARLDAVAPDSIPPKGEL